ncbi:hypothetical protein [Rheinheimera sp. MMS21-TC3]|uniref:hypothetical protein n=1 Tax=Rheinheimera sp. MMS21-TC3 TaxID=3072790 RepID=UPI0028C4E34E|nr:hypothetical protein [Rheinheimera sp. MMS21-TC3]WNO60342.1 hypothetical protein RDV63_05095 [Rheinheimera sp. MMS21-TC3]
MKKINLLNTDSNKADFKLLENITLDDKGNDEVSCFANNNLLVIYEISRGKNYNTEDQTELPLSALQWIKDTIVDGFWRLPSQGGLPKNQHTCMAKFAGEELLIGRSMNAGEYGKAGFKIVNKSRSSHILASQPQTYQITDERVESVLLPLLSKLGVN